MTKQALSFEIKEIAADGSFEGMLSPYGNIDQAGDIVQRGSYKKTLNDNGNEVPCLWQHKSDQPIGKLMLEDRPEGLWCKGQLLMELPEAKKAYLLIKARIVKGLSIGFSTIKDEVKEGIRHLLEIRLFEGSIVTFPANLAAQITAVKRSPETKGDFNEELLEIQLRDSAYQMESALCRSLHSLMWAGMSKEDALTAAQATIEQFGNAYLAFLPNFIDMMMAEHGPMEMWSSKRGLEMKAAAGGYKVGDRVQVKKGMEHDEETMSVPGTVELVSTPALGIRFDDMEEVHKWYVAEELSPYAKSQPAIEAKSGAMISLANRTKLKEAHAQMMSAMEIISALCDDEAGSTTSKSEAAPQETKPEPVPDHSALSPLLTQFKENLTWNLKSN